MSHTRKLRLPIPTTIITGSLNAGKSTTLLALLSCKPADQVWAVLVNEAGAIGIDPLLFQSPHTPSPASVAVRELSGGCLCCVSPTVTSAAIVQLVQRSKPDRLLIGTFVCMHVGLRFEVEIWFDINASTDTFFVFKTEPSGLAHPKELLLLLQNQYLSSSLRIEPIVCLVNLLSFPLHDDASGGGGDDGGGDNGDAEGEINAETEAAVVRTKEHVEMADIVIGTKADVCTSRQLDLFLKWASKLTPRKNKVITCASELITPQDIDMELRGGHTNDAEGDEDDDDHDVVVGVSALSVEQEEENGGSNHAIQSRRRRRRQHDNSKTVWLSNRSGASPTRLVEDGIDSTKMQRRHVVTPTACVWGWRWPSPKDVFDEDKLRAFVTEARPYYLRIKGICRTNKNRWVLVNVGNDSHDSAEEGGEVLTELRGTAATYPDSRIEIIRDTSSSTCSNKSTSALQQEQERWDGVEHQLVACLTVATDDIDLVC